MNPIDNEPPVVADTETQIRLPIADPGAPPSHLAVRMAGAGEAARECEDGALAVLYMHGFASSQSGTKAAFFRQRFLDLGLPCCSFDFQGHGDSGGCMRDLTLTRNLADIARVQGHLREQGYRRVLLFGSSMGAASALWYAVLHPGGVAATVSISPALEIEKALLAMAGTAGAERWQREGTLVMEHPLGPQELGWGLIEDVRTYELTRLKSSYQAPALIFQGKHDDSVDWRTTVDFATGCAYESIDLHLMADGDHRLVDRLDHLWRLTASFLEARSLV